MDYKRITQQIYSVLVKTNNSNQKVALGVATGVFLGLIPGLGPLTALVAATILKLNKAAAVFGSLLTNTWLTIILGVLAAKIGAVLLGLNWLDIWNQSKELVGSFEWPLLFRLTAIKIIAPILLGYVIIGLFLALLAYLISLFLIKRYRTQR